MSRMIDWKGGNLKHLNDNGGVAGNIDDIRELADVLDEHAPKSDVAIRTRAIVARFDDLNKQATQDVCDVWAQMARDRENGFPWADCVTRNVVPLPSSVRPMPRDVQTAQGIVQKAKKALTQIESLRDELLTLVDNARGE